MKEGRKEGSRGNRLRWLRNAVTVDKKTKAQAKGAEKVTKALVLLREVQHPPHTQTIARGAAMDRATPKLKKEELDTLPYEKFANNGALMRLHDLEHVDLFIEKRNRWLDRTLPTSQLRAPFGAQVQAGPPSSVVAESTSSAPQEDQPLN
ncbi:unnamed protein product [Peniophora sp. CBMAI 1063]|nr:unnamed protein product [Peniophora sp. CBMAI 1063]